MFSERTRKIMRDSAALLWLGSVFFVTPLAFCRLGGEKVPLFGLVSAVTLPVLSLIAAAFAGSFTDFRVYRRDFRWRLLGCVQIAVLAVSLWHWCRGGTWENFLLSIFFVLAPTVGMALKSELEKFLGWFALLWTVLLILSGINSAHFTGFIGNWNWTQAMLAAVLPGCFMLFKLKHWQLWSFVALAGVFALIWFCYPAQLSRSMLIAIPAATVILAVQQSWRISPLLRKFHPAWMVGVLIAALVLFTIYADFDSSRLQLWKGTLDMLLSRGTLGVGMGGFANEILPFIPEKYYFTEFAAAWHPHPHNEVLNFACAYGIAGVIYFWVLIYMALALPPRSDRELFSRWIFLILLIGGMFDMSCAAGAGALWCFSCAGISGGRYRSCRTVHTPAVIPAVLLIVCAMVMTVMNICSTSAWRQGELALVHKNWHQARKFLRKSSANEAKYLLAEMELMVFNAPENAASALAEMKQDYLHSSRLKALVYYKSGDLPRALQEMDREYRKYPFSVINANWYYQLLKAANAPVEVIALARQRFWQLCHLREITPAQAAKLSSGKDDRSLKNPAR